MRKSMREIFEAIANLGRTLSEALDRATADGSEYGGSGIEVERRRAVTVWKRAAVGFLESFQAEIVALRERGAVDSTRFLESVRAGRVPGSAPGSSLATPYMLEETRAQIRATEAAAATMASVRAELAFSNRLAIAQFESTVELREQLKRYLEDAERGATFAYEAFAVDGKIIPLVLRRRADGGDPLADHTATENFVGRIETALLRRGGPELCDDADLRLFEQVRSAIGVLDPSTLRGLDDVQSVLAMIGRLVGLKVVNVPPRELPAPRHRSQAVTNPDWPAGMPAA